RRSRHVRPWPARPSAARQRPARRAASLDPPAVRRPRQPALPARRKRTTAASRHRRACEPRRRRPLPAGAESDEGGSGSLRRAVEHRVLAVRVYPDQIKAEHLPEPTSAAQQLRDLALLRRARDRIDREYAQPLDVEAIARGAHMSAGHFSRQFRLAYGESPYSYLMTRRVERAMALLRRGGVSVTEVCFAVGCSSLGTFSSRFTELVGVPPSTYRRDAARATAGMPPCVAKQVTRPIRNRDATLSDPP